MSKFLINSESSEDTFAVANNLPEATRAARNVAAQLPAGEVVCIEHEGKVVLSLVRLPSGELLEQTPTKPADRKPALPEYSPAVSGNSIASTPSQ